MSEDLLSHQDGPVLRITINRPDDGNRVTDEMALEMTRLLESAADASRFVVLGSAGQDFCNGWTGPAAGLPHEVGLEAYEARRQFDAIFNCYGAFRRARVPVVGVVRGRARGFGCAIAALCDLTLAADTASFQVPEMSFNVLPTMVMSALIDRVAMKPLSHLVYTTEEIDAARALGLGIVSKVVPAGELDANAAALCTALLKRPQPALLGVKEYVMSAGRMDTQGAVDFARNLHAAVNTSTQMKTRR